LFAATSFSIQKKSDMFSHTYSLFASIVSYRVYPYSQLCATGVTCELTTNEGISHEFVLRPAGLAAVASLPASHGGSDTPIVHRGTQSARTDTFLYTIDKENLHCQLDLNIEADAIDFSLEGDPRNDQGITIITGSSKRLYESSPQLRCRSETRPNSTVLPFSFSFDCPRLDRVLQNVIMGHNVIVGRQKNTPVGTCDVWIGSESFQPIVRL
jgi:hypothetical protein